MRSRNFIARELLEYAASDTEWWLERGQDMFDRIKSDSYEHDKRLCIRDRLMTADYVFICRSEAYGLKRCASIAEAKMFLSNNNKHRLSFDELVLFDRIGVGDIVSTMYGSAKLYEPFRGAEL